jgi:hypothetical protein
MTRLGYCLRCASERVFSHVMMDDYACMVCATKRTLTINQVTETNKGGQFGRFWANVKVTPYCWPWVTPYDMRYSSPKFQMNKIGNNAGRVAYYFSRGIWPKAAVVRSCFNKLCMRPDHLVTMDVSDISKYLSRMGRLKGIKHKPKRLCRKRGHAMVGDNVGWQNGGRLCKKCRNMNRARRYKAKMELLRRKSNDNEGTKQDVQRGQPIAG